MVPLSSALNFIMSAGRGVGKTYELAQLCKAKNWTLVCGNAKQAKDVARTYGVQTVALGSFKPGMKYGACVLDNYALQPIMNRIAELEEEVRSLEEQLSWSGYGEDL